MSACTAHICTICLLCTHTQCLNVYINIIVHCTMLVHSRSDRACVHVTNHEMYMYLNNVYTVYYSTQPCRTYSEIASTAYMQA